MSIGTSSSSSGALSTPARMPTRSIVTRLSWGGLARGRHRPQLSPARCMSSIRQIRGCRRVRAPVLAMVGECLVLPGVVYAGSHHLGPGVSSGRRLTGERADGCGEGRWVIDPWEVRYMRLGDDGGVVEHRCASRTTAGVAIGSRSPAYSRTGAGSSFRRPVPSVASAGRGAADFTHGTLMPSARSAAVERAHRSSGISAQCIQDIGGCVVWPGRAARWEGAGHG